MSEVETVVEEPKAKRGRPRKETPVAPDHLAALTDAMSRIAALTATLAEKQGIDAGALGDALAGAFEKNRKATIASNPDPTYSSPSCFEPAGVKKAKLVREVYTNAHPEREAQLTPMEVDAINLLSASLPNPGMIRTSRNGKWRAQVNMEGTRLQITWPCKGIDDMANAPKSLILLCRELTDGTEVATVDTMMNMIVKLQQQNDLLMKAVSNRPDLAALLQPA